MLKNIKDIKVGDVLRIEYGTYDNFVNFTVDEIVQEDDSFKAKCHRGYIEERFSFRPEEEVEVLENA